MLFRPYHSSDQLDCLRIFDSNCPFYFHSSEQGEFAAFLEKRKHPFFVIESLENQIVACGGFSRTHAPDYIHLRWGMVQKDSQRQGIGRQLLQGRLFEICQEVNISVVKVFTSQLVKGFYEKEGFVLKQIVPDGIAPGFDRYELDYVLNDKRRFQLMAA